MSMQLTRGSVGLATLAVTVALLAGCTSGGSGNAAPTSRHSQTASSTPLPPLPSACTYVSAEVVGRALHARVSRGRSSTEHGDRTCVWKNSAGSPVATLTLAGYGNPMVALLDALAERGAHKVRGLGATAVFAPRPPRLVVHDGQYAAIVTLQPAASANKPSKALAEIAKAMLHH